MSNSHRKQNHRRRRPCGRRYRDHRQVHARGLCRTKFFRGPRQESRFHPSTICTPPTATSRRRAHSPTSGEKVGSFFSKTSASAPRSLYTSAGPRLRQDRQPRLGHRAGARLQQLDLRYLFIEKPALQGDGTDPAARARGGSHRARRIVRDLGFCGAMLPSTGRQYAASRLARNIGRFTAKRNG